MSQGSVATFSIFDVLFNEKLLINLLIYYRPA